jgi:hypothetical protein
MAPLTLRIADVQPRRGLAWVSGSFALFLKHPLGFSLLFLAFLVAAMVLLAIPYLGSVLVLAALPLLTLGFMSATRAAVAGGTVHAGQLVEPLLPSADRARRAGLLRLCALYAVVTALVMLLSDAADGGTFERLQVLLAGTRDEAANKAIDALLTDPQLHTGLILRFGLSALLSVPFWHAPPLVAWHGQGVAQSLFSSTLACWRNKGAFALYFAAWTATVIAFGVVAGLLFGALGMPQMFTLAALPAGLMFSTAFYVSLYFTFTESFDVGAVPPPPAPAT